MTANSAKVGLVILHITIAVFINMTYFFPRRPEFCIKGY